MLDRKAEVAEVYKKKAKDLRYQKPIVKSLNWWEISEGLSDIMSECADVKWMTEDYQQLIDLLDGDEEQAFEFRTVFSILESDCFRMLEDMEEVRKYEFMSALSDDDDEATLFDLFFPAIGTEGPYLGYDEYVHDYFPLESFENEFSTKVAKKKLKKLTKDQIFDLAGMCLNVARNYLSIDYRYTSLKAAIDVLKGINEGILATVKTLDDAWANWEKETKGGKIKYTDAEARLDRLLNDMPERLWVE